VVEAVTGGRGTVARKARVEYWADRLMGSTEVVGGWRSSNSSSLMGDEGSAVVTGAGRARKGEVEEKRVERVVEEDMGGAKSGMKSGLCFPKGEPRTTKKVNHPNT